MLGISPKTIPTTIEKATDTIIAGVDIDTGTSAIFAMTFDKPMPISTPSTPPIVVSTEASVRN